MNLGELRTNTSRRLGEATATFYDSAALTNWINQGQIELCLLRLAMGAPLLEKRATITTTANDWRIYPHALLSDFVWPTRLSHNSRKLDRAADRALDRAMPNWRGQFGEPRNWGIVGANFMFINPAPRNATNLTLVYAYSPVALSADSDVPEVPVELHWILSEYATYMALLKEGEAKLGAALAHYERFLGGSSGK